MRFFVGLAALVWTLGQVGPLGWFVLFMLAVAGACLLLWAWPALLVLGIIVGTWLVARHVERRQANPFR